MICFMTTYFYQHNKTFIHSSLQRQKCLMICEMNSHGVIFVQKEDKKLAFKWHKAGLVINDILSTCTLKALSERSFTFLQMCVWNMYTLCSWIYLSSLKAQPGAAPPLCRPGWTAPSSCPNQRWRQTPRRARRSSAARASQPSPHSASMFRSLGRSVWQPAATWSPCSNPSTGWSGLHKAAVGHQRKFFVIITGCKHIFC